MSGKSEAVSLVGEIQSTSRRLTMTADTSRATIDPATSYATVALVNGIIGSRWRTLATGSVPGLTWRWPRITYGPTLICRRLVWSWTRCFSDPRGPVAMRAGRSDRSPWLLFAGTRRAAG